MTNTPLARLEHMITTAPHGADAARLLQNLVVFQGLFPRAAVIAMTPEDMSEMQRIDAFETLCQWRLVRKMSHRRYRIDNAVKALVPPSHEVLLGYVLYWGDLLTTSDDMNLYLYWNDITCALVWGLQHWPDKIAEISKQFPSRIWHLREEWPQIIDRLFAVSKAASQLFPPTSLHPSLERWQDQLLEFHINEGHPNAHEYRLMRYAEAAFINQDLPTARRYYERAVRLNGTSPQWRVLAALQGLFDVIVLQKEITAVYSTVDQFKALIQGSSESLHHLGRIMVKIDDKDAARHYFANALQVNERGRQNPYRNSLLFQDWARLENQDGNFQEAAVLYRLALGQGMFNVERHIETYSLGDDISRTLARIDHAWHDFERLSREWRVIESRHQNHPPKPSQPLL